MVYLFLEWKVGDFPYTNQWVDKWGMGGGQPMGLISMVLTADLNHHTILKILAYVASDII